MDRHFRPFIDLALMWRYQAALADAIQTQESVPRQAVVLLLLGSFLMELLRLLVFLHVCLSSFTFSAVSSYF